MKRVCQRQGNTEVENLKSFILSIVQYLANNIDSFRKWDDISEIGSSDTKDINEILDMIEFAASGYTSGRKGRDAGNIEDCTSTLETIQKYVNVDYKKMIDGVNSIFKKFKAERKYDSVGNAINSAYAFARVFYMENGPCQDFMTDMQKLYINVIDEFEMKRSSRSSGSVTDTGVEVFNTHKKTFASALKKYMDHDQSPENQSAKAGFMYFTKNLQIMGKMMPEMLKSFIDNGRNDELMGDAVKTVDMAEDEMGLNFNKIAEEIEIQAVSLQRMGICGPENTDKDCNELVQLREQFEEPTGSSTLLMTANIFFLSAIFMV